MDNHPGGADLILPFAGKDGSNEFEKAFHSGNAREQLKDYLIGKFKKSKSQIKKEKNTLFIPTGNMMGGYPSKKTSKNSGYPPKGSKNIGLKMSIPKSSGYPPRIPKSSGYPPKIPKSSGYPPRKV